jgi:hypothetical protein
MAAEQPSQVKHPKLVARARTHARTHTHAHTHTHIYIRVYTLNSHWKELCLITIKKDRVQYPRVFSEAQPIK